MNIGRDDTRLTGANAGHIARVSITHTVITRQGRKEGEVRYDMSALRKSADREKVAQGSRMISGREAVLPYIFKQNHWYLLSLKFVGHRMLDSIDGQLLRYLKPKIDPTTEAKLVSNCQGDERADEIHFDDLRILPVRLQVEKSLLGGLSVLTYAFQRT